MTSRTCETHLAVKNRPRSGPFWRVDCKTFLKIFNAIRKKALDLTDLSSTKLESRESPKEKVFALLAGEAINCYGDTDRYGTTKFDTLLVLLLSKILPSSNTIFSANSHLTEKIPVLKTLLGNNSTHVIIQTLK